jgi:hypothetical protein
MPRNNSINNQYFFTDYQLFDKLYLNALQSIYIAWR